MEITRKYAKKLIQNGKARTEGRTIDQGWIWEIISRIDKQRTDHVRIERTMATKAAEISVWPDNINQAASVMGRKGGAVKSERKSATSRQNGRKGGRPAIATKP